MKKSRIYLLGISTGLILALAFPPMPMFLFAYIGFIPLLLALEEKQFKKPFLLLYLTFFIYHGGTNWWISSWQAETDPYLMLSGFATWLMHPFFFFIPFGFYLFIRRRTNLNTALAAFPFVWTAYEWFHSLGDFSYPWLSIGYTQIYNKLWVQMADLGGVWLVTFCVVAVNVIIFKLLTVYREKRFEKGFFRSVLKDKYLHPLTDTLLLLIIVPLIYGYFRSEQFNHKDLIKNYELVRIGVIQPNIDPWKKWRGGVFEQIAKHKHIQDSLRFTVGKLDVAIWSETAIPFMNFDFNSSHQFSFLQNWIDTSGTSLLTGFTDIYFYNNRRTAPKTAKPLNQDSNRIYEAFNSALFLNPSPNQNVQIYRKMKLTPFAERIPYEEYLLFLRKYIEWGVGISSWAKGREQIAFHLDNKGKKAGIGSIICIESIYPDFVRGFVLKGANILTVITNDAWYNYTFGPEQHFQIAAMRAIETRRYIARCANTGVSGFISPKGEAMDRLPQYKTSALAYDIPALDEKSIYVKAGDWLPECSAGITFFLVFFAFFKKKK
ncbi:MAG: apolipoprotein N-acyltransferase [Bacteroidota bacterium]